MQKEQKKILSLSDLISGQNKRKLMKQFGISIMTINKYLNFDVQFDDKRLSVDPKDFYEEALKLIESDGKEKIQFVKDERKKIKQLLKEAA